MPQELGIKDGEVKPDDFTYLGRIHYLAPSGDGELWGEHESESFILVKIDFKLMI